MLSHNSSTGNLYIVSGLPGVGKSTVSNILSEHADGEVLRTDEIRKELFDDPQYDSEETDTTYKEMLSRASDKLLQGKDVVLDATFSDKSKRVAARELSQSIGSDVLFVKVEADEEVVEERLANRKNDVSDADYEVYKDKKQSFDRFSKKVETIDNSGELSETETAVKRLVRTHE